MSAAGGSSQSLRLHRRHLLALGPNRRAFIFLGHITQRGLRLGIEQGVGQAVALCRLFTQEGRTLGRLHPQPLAEAAGAFPDVG